MLSPSTFIIIAILLGAVFLWLGQRYYRHYSIPGPFLCRFTNLPRALWVGSRKSHEIHRNLHEQYGSVVRFGPNMVSVADPAAISIIYPARAGFLKGDFYHVFKSPNDPPDAFTAQDETVHKALRTPVSRFYSLSKLQIFEGVIDENMKNLFGQLDHASSESSYSLTAWLQSFAFDTIWAWMFTKPYGLIEMGADEAKQILDANWEVFKIIGPMSQSPTLRSLGSVVHLALSALKINAVLPLHKQTMDLIKTREEQFELPSEKAGSGASNSVDMMSQLLLLKSHQPTILPWAVSSLSLLNVFAGSDSTATVMGTIWYNLLLHRHTMQRLYDELLAAESCGSLTRTMPTWRDVQNLSYLDACVKEALRLHPPFCLPFERVVPETGLTFGDFHLPPGTLVGMSPYVVGRHRPTFGEDVDLWRPERWVECTSQQRRKMEQSMITFGSGRRVCLGKDVALMEIKKLVSAVLLQYEMEAIDVARFKTENSWFFRQEGLEVRIRRRCL